MKKNIIIYNLNLKEVSKIKRIKFDKIAKIHSGIRKTSLKNKGNKYIYNLISLNNENDFIIDKNNMEQITTDKKIDEKYLLNKGDIILKLTPPYTAKIIDLNEENITTTSNYAIIKINSDYEPELINFYLNSEYIKKQIYYLAAETSIKVITIKNIKDFQIVDIENDKKDIYTKLIKTYKNKRELMEKQLELEKNLLEEIIFGEK